MRIPKLRLGPALALSGLLLLAAEGSGARAQGAPVERLPREVLDIAPPAERVDGALGAQRVVASACPSLPLASARRRIVDAAAQEWAYFGFSVTDRRVPRGESRLSGFLGRGGNQSWRRGASRERLAEFARVAPSIAGYWAATPGGSWALERQNARWAESTAGAARWRDPWSAAFVSWVYCVSGLGEPDRFQRSIAHRDYVDQAIRARDGRAPSAALRAYDPGEATILPGDLVCSATRSGYQTIDQRRRQLGRAASMHCDIVVSVDAPADEILTIGGNVYGTVSLKRMPAVRERGTQLHPRDDIFAHLALDADPIEADALRGSPSIAALGCGSGFAPPSPVTGLGLPLGDGACDGAAPSRDARAPRLEYRLFLLVP
ncbi:MAG: DUF2272 domain-containing protein [Caldilineae bacterium]|nr:DUF2272 domain-containing protein [Caldilineae bacterium]